MRKVYRNTYEGKLFGVCFGLADHFDTDPVLLRILFICSVLFLGIGLIPYFLLAIITHEKPRII
mgnify:CR=1 FL=1|tara:strand:- start:223 stop:414 length:192 start_codon:yes stop_codon:yes gene_type:complete